MRTEKISFPYNKHGLFSIIKLLAVEIPRDILRQVAAILLQHRVAQSSQNNWKTIRELSSSPLPLSFSLYVFWAICSEQQQRNSGDAVWFKRDQSFRSYQGCQWERYQSGMETHMHTYLADTYTQWGTVCASCVTAHESAQARRYTNRPIHTNAPL